MPVSVEPTDNEIAMKAFNEILEGQKVSSHDKKDTPQNVREMNSQPNREETYGQQMPVYQMPVYQPPLQQPVGFKSNNPLLDNLVKLLSKSERFLISEKGNDPSYHGGHLHFTRIDLNQLKFDLVLNSGLVITCPKPLSIVDYYNQNPVRHQMQILLFFGIMDLEEIRANEEDTVIISDPKTIGQYAEYITWPFSIFDFMETFHNLLVLRSLYSSKDEDKVLNKMDIGRGGDFRKLIQFFKLESYLMRTDEPKDVLKTRHQIFLNHMMTNTHSGEYLEKLGEIIKNDPKLNGQYRLVILAQGKTYIPFSQYSTQQTYGQ